MGEGKPTPGLTVFYEVGELNDPAAEPFVVLRVDTNKRVGSGVEAVVQSLHWSREEAELAAESHTESATAEGRAASAAGREFTNRQNGETYAKPC